MAFADSLQVALKEWAVVCRALGRGRQVVLLRKGGVHEAVGGFALEHERFLLFPTYLHQNPAMLKPAERAAMEPAAAEPARITLELAAEVTDIIRLKDRPAMDATDDEHIWAPPLIDMRFNYKPHNPLYLLLVRCRRLPQAVTIDNTPAYAGCKSWVPLAEPIPTAGATPVLDDEAYETRCRSILKRLP